MSVLRADIVESFVYENETLNVEKCDYIFIENLGNANAFFGKRLIPAGKSIEISTNFVLNSQSFDLRFDKGTIKTLYIMLVKVTRKCNN